MPLSSSQAKFTVEVLGLGGPVLVLVSMFLNWTKASSFFDVIGYSLPWAWLPLLVGLVVFALATVYLVLGKGAYLLPLVIQIVATGIMLLVFLGITNIFQGFLELFDIGYFFCGLGIIVCIFQILFFLLYRGQIELSESDEELTTVVDESRTDEIEKKFYEALDSDIRRKILRLIGENGGVTFTKFKAELKVSTGTLYHHLNTLAQLVFQKKDKRYYLTSLGELTLRFMDENRPHLGAIKEEEMLEKTTFFGQKMFSALKIEKFHAALFGRSNRTSRLLLLVPVVFYVLGAFLGFQTIFYYFVSSPFHGTVPVFTPVLQVPAFALEGFGSWIVAWGLIELASYLNFKKKVDLATSFAATGICSFPLFIYEIVAFSLRIAGIDLGPLGSGILLFLAMFATLYLLITFQMYFKGIMAERAISIVLPTNYISIFFYLIVFIVL
jgi:hypothetical protein